MYKSGRKHIDVDHVSRSPADSSLAGINNDDQENILCALNVHDMMALQRYDSELRALVEHLGERGSTVPCVFSRALSTFTVEQRRKNVFSPSVE